MAKGAAPITTINLETARAFARAGRIPEAERAYASLADCAAPPLEALSFLAMRAFQTRDIGRAVALLKRAVSQAPDDPRFRTDLGLAQRAQGDLVAAEKSFRAAIEAEPAYFLAHLHLGTLLEARGDAAAALPRYFAAVVHAQAQGEWTRPEAVKPGLAREVGHAMERVRAGRRALFDAAIAPLRARYGKDSLTRIERALAIYLQEAPADIPDPRQRPQFLYMPGIPPRTYYAREELPWIGELEAATDAIRAEAAVVLAAGALEPFLESDDPVFVAAQLKGEKHAPVWDAFHFFRNGERYDDNHARAPKTSAVLEGLPLARIPGHAPEVCFSVLTPGTHIQRHTGVTNSRIVVHLPLIVPENCAISVGGELHEWQEGRCMAFDDTFEHEAWNRSSGHVRVVLLMDAWNPHVSEAERQALTDLIVTIGDFNFEALGRR